MEQWIAYNMGELVDLSQGQVINAQTNHLVVKEGLPLLRITDMINNNQVIFIDQDKVPTKNIAKPEDIIYTRTGQVGLVFTNQFGVVHNNCFKVKPKTEKLDRLFLYWFLRADFVYKFVNNVASGSAQPDLPHSSFKSIKLKLPPLSIQQKIASILSAYDELIENNNQRIKLLEEMAEEIYKEWFVRLRFPGYESTKFYDADGKEVAHGTVGALPEGWEKAKLRDCFSRYIGGGWGEETTKGKYSEPAYVIRGTDIPNARIGNLNFDVLRYHSVSNLSSRLLKKKDIIFEVSGGTESQSLGRTVFMSQSLIDKFDHGVICASFCKSIRVKEDYISAVYIYLLLNRLYVTGEIMLFQVQSTGISNYKFEDFIERQKVLIPKREIQVAFENIVMPMLDEIQILGSKNQLLQQTRDLLLPRLISGKLSVNHLLDEEENLSMAAEPELSYSKNKI